MALWVTSLPVLVLVSTLLCIVGTVLFNNLRAEQEVNFVNINTPGDVKVMRSGNVGQVMVPDMLSCSVLCVNTDGCNSFFYNHNKHDCVLHHDILAPQQGSNTKWRYLYKKGSKTKQEKEKVMKHEKTKVVKQEKTTGVKFHKRFIVMPLKMNKTWLEAQRVCDQYLKTTLAMPKTKGNQLFMRKLGHLYRGFYWIGLKDLYKNNTFMWCDGTPLKYPSWANNEPSNTHGPSDEDCVTIMLSENKNPIHWSDQPCGNRYYAMCQDHSET